MSGRIEKINELMRQELASILSREIYLDDGLITVVRVGCSANLKSAAVSISVLPENLSGSALRLLQKSNALVNKFLVQRLKLRGIPKLHWKIDNQERYAADLEKVFAELRKEENDQG